MIEAIDRWQPESYSLNSDVQHGYATELLEKHVFMGAESVLPPRNFLFCLDLVGLTRLAVTN